MAKPAKPKPEVKKGRNSDRQNGKAPKQRPKNNSETPGKTQGGYSKSALERRTAAREPVTLAGLGRSKGQKSVVSDNYNKGNENV